MAVRNCTRDEGRSFRFGYQESIELLQLFKKGTASHVNNISLGKRGRHRPNTWTLNIQFLCRFRPHRSFY
jgi:hypothetical protein